MSVRRLFVIRRWIMWRLDGCCVIMVDIYIYIIVSLSSVSLLVLVLVM